MLPRAPSTLLGWTQWGAAAGVGPFEVALSGCSQGLGHAGSVAAIACVGYPFSVLLLSVDNPWLVFGSRPVVLPNELDRARANTSTQRPTMVERDRLDQTVL